MGKADRQETEGVVGSILVLIIGRPDITIRTGVFLGVGMLIIIASHRHLRYRICREVGGLAENGETSSDAHSIYTGVLLPFSSSAVKIAKIEAPAIAKYEYLAIGRFGRAATSEHISPAVCAYLVTGDIQGAPTARAKALPRGDRQETYHPQW